MVYSDPLNFALRRKKLKQGTSIAKAKKPAPATIRVRGFLYMIKLKAVVGEYGRDQGFFLPNPVSIHPEYPRSRFRVAWCM
ncbi:MAG: hypothetical protein QG568_550 [Patescibacteria group bacterium]|nr:hypothetical protein [Patescibacteria group bacterium]